MLPFPILTFRDINLVRNLFDLVRNLFVFIRPLFALLLLIHELEWLIVLQPYLFIHFVKVEREFAWQEWLSYLQVYKLLISVIPTVFMAHALVERGNLLALMCRTHVPVAPASLALAKMRGLH